MTRPLNPFLGLLAALTTSAFLDLQLFSAPLPPFPKELAAVKRENYWIHPDETKLSEKLFGGSLAASEDTLAVMSWGVLFDGRTYFPGDISIYAREGNGWAYSVTLSDPHPIPSGARFGESIAISGDTLIVGTPGASSAGSGVNPPYAEAPLGQGSGSAYIFVKRNGTWSLQATLKAPNPDALDAFGLSVAVAGDYAFVAAPFEEGSGSGENPAFNNEFANDGFGSVGAGAVYVYARKDGEWHFETYLKHPDNKRLRRFGDSIAAWGDTLAIGGTQYPGVSGSVALVYVRSGANWVLQAALHPQGPDSGSAPTVAIHKDTLVTGHFQAGGVPPEWPNQQGGQQSGSVHVFARTGSTWSWEAYLKALWPKDYGQFGKSVAVWGDYILAGETNDPGDGVDLDPPWNFLATGSGAAYLYHRSAGSWSLPLYIKPFNNYAKSGMNQGAFGGQVALVSSGFFVTSLDQSFPPPTLARAYGALHVYSYAGSGNPETLVLDFSLEAAEGGLAISWPTIYGNVILESVDNLSAQWGPVQLQPIEVNGVKRVVLPTNTADARFFRLRAPL